MNNWIKRLCTAAFFPAALTCILLALWLFPPAVPVDNITPAEDIISRDVFVDDENKISRVSRYEKHGRLEDM